MRFSERDRATIRTLAEVLIPDGGPLPSARDVGAADLVAASIRRMEPGPGSRVTLLVRLLSASPFSTGRPRRFRHLRPAARAALIERFSKRGGARGQMMGALKQLVVVTWASHPVVTEALGDDGSCLADSPDHAEVVGPYLPPEASVPR